MTNKKSNESLEFEVFKLEYKNLADGHRHTYQTIWQTGSVFTAISAALLAFSTLFYSTSANIELLIRWIWPLPYLFWWLAIFTPMDKYGKLRLQRLRELEELTQKKEWGHKMKILEYSEVLTKRQKIICLPKFKVGQGVDIFSIIIIIIWVSFNVWIYFFN